MRWQDPAPPPANNALTEFGLTPRLSRFLLRRGIDSAAAARAFLDPQHAPAAPAFDLPDMEAAAARLKLAIRNGERILIWGDFDVDGQTSTATLVESLTALGALVSYHIPNRQRESHGIRPEVLAKLLDERQPALILTCDTGSSAQEGIRLAKSRGVEVIVSDHHELPAELPPADFLINPRRLPDEHPLASLAGVGVAFKVAEALGADTAPLLDLAALGLVADVALLRGETRALVQRGLQALQNTPRPGLLAMLKLAEVKAATLTESGIGFTLAPRLNALGRLSDATPAVELLTTHDENRAQLLAETLEELNLQRRHLTRQVSAGAESLLRQSPELLSEAAIVLHHPDWPNGILGIAANHLVERYQKPVILFCGSDPLRGSARSVDGIHITNAIAACGLAANSFGGHPMAAGLALPAAELNNFRRNLTRAIRAQSGGKPPEAVLPIEEWLPLSDISLELAEEMQRLAPFGAGNPAPIFASRAVTLQQDIKDFGKTREHRKIIVSDERGAEQSLMWWGGADEPTPEGRFDIAYTLRAETWQGQKRLTLELTDWRPTEESPLEIHSTLKVVDLRPTPDPQTALSGWQNAAPDAILWAEGEKHKTLPGALNREKLTRADTLLIWTTPPDGQTLRQALAIVQPRRVVIFRQPPEALEAGEFLRLLMGKIKFVLNQRDGQTRLSELAAACAQTENAITWALKTLAADGQLSVEWLAEGQICLQAASAAREEAAKGQAFLNLQKSLQESAAYRASFARQDLTKLLDARPSIG
ncbi:MAG: single-stranded-DNA-specific exonuclease RecJ [Anaerolineales bacterium]